MSYEYDQYLNQHIANVQKAWDWMRENLTDLYDIFEVQDLVSKHDQSKMEADEYWAYDNYFYGPVATRKSYNSVKSFHAAFLKHIHRNPHHWQYWVLIHDDPDEKFECIEMPVNYIYEMICDWWSFSWTKGDLMEIFTWWDAHKDYILLGRKTRKTVEEILGEIKDKLKIKKGTEE